MVTEPLRQSDLFEGLSIFPLRYYGLWYHMNVYRKTGKKDFLVIARTIAVHLFYLPYVSFQFTYLIITDLTVQKIAFAYLVIAPIADQCIKILFFWHRLKEMCKIYDGLRQDFLTSIPQSKRLMAWEIYRRTARRCNIMLVASYTTMLITMIPYITVPGYAIEETGSSRKKVLNGWYPFSYNESPWYEIVYIYEVLVVSFGGTNYYIYQVVLLIPLICLCGHFDVLCFHIATLKKDGNNNSSLNQQLREILKDYEMLNRYSDELIGLYNIIVSVLLGLGIVNVTTVALHIIFEKKDPIFLLKNGAFFCFQGIELCLICWCSSMMETSSSNIHHALYCNDWYLADKNFARTQQMMMIRASKQLTLTAAKMYKINLETLLSIFQFIYSTAAVLSKAN